MRNHPRGAAVYGIDIGKVRFDVVGLDERGAVLHRTKFRRDTLLAHFAAAPRALVGMEACPGSQWLARKLRDLGHDVRILPAQFVKPYVKSNKNDVRDAEAIAEAVTRPTMRSVEIRTPEQIDVQALHRVRDRMVSNRTRLISQMRAFCLDYGLPIREGAGAFKVDLARILADEENDLTPRSRQHLTDCSPRSPRIRHCCQAWTRWHCVPPCRASSSGTAPGLASMHLPLVPASPAVPSPARGSRQAHAGHSRSSRRRAFRAARRTVVCSGGLTARSFPSTWRAACRRSE